MKKNQQKQPQPAPAATIVLAREHSGELQFYLLKRSSKSGFMAGNYVFPGGVVDAEDFHVAGWGKYIDLSPAAISKRLGAKFDQHSIIAYGVAAIRETFEEAGVLLAHAENHNTADLKQLQQLRLSATLPKGWLQNLVTSQPWVLAFSGLYRWSHWITPEKMKRRYDTRFFLASMPADQVCRPDTRETTHGVWTSPEKGLSGNLSGEFGLSPPTVVTLHQLLRFQSLDDLIQHATSRPWGEALVPRLVPAENGAVIVEPWDPMYNQNEIRLSSAALAENCVEVGQPFSRLWHHQGIWRPVKA